MLKEKRKGLTMQNFVYQNPTKIYFGQGALSGLPLELEAFGKNILLVYGKNAIKSIGLYDQILSLLIRANKTVTELSGINPNPRYAQVLEGARLVRENQIDLILAVGGGSVIDCSKAISVCAYANGDPWQRFWIDKEDVSHKIIPVAAVLTMAGTASEMNSGSVITNEEKMLKCGRVFPSFVNPRFSILDPTYTYSVPKRQMLSGIFDIMSHLMEQYFGGEGNNICDDLIEGLLRGVIRNARAAVKNPKDYETRANIMWASTMALNKIIAVSKEQDWEVHAIEHQLGAYTDCPHGEGLAVISVPYYRYIAPNAPEKFTRFAKNVWDIDTNGMEPTEAAEAGIRALSSFIREMGMPTTLRELGAEESMLEKIAASTDKGGGYRFMDTEDILKVLRACF